MSRPANKLPPVPPTEAAELAVVAADLGMRPAELQRTIVRAFLAPRAALVMGEPAPDPAVRCAREREAARRFALLDRWLKAGRPQAGTGGASLRTLYVWWRQFRQGGVAGLIDRRGGGGAKKDRGEHDQFFRELRRQLLTGSRLNVSAAYRAVAGRARANGWAVPSLKAAQRYVWARRQARAA